MTSYNETETPFTLLLGEGAVTIEKAATIKTLLLQAFDTYHNLEIDLSKVTELDVPILQLICAAFFEAKKRNIELHLIGSLHPDVQSLLILSGFVNKECKDGPEMEQVFNEYLMAG